VRKRDPSIIIIREPYNQRVIFPRLWGLLDRIYFEIIQLPGLCLPSRVGLTSSSESLRDSVDDREIALLRHSSSALTSLPSFVPPRSRCWLSASSSSFFLSRFIISHFIPIFLPPWPRILVPLLLISFINEKSD
jgi:hypothetical protein